MFQPYAEYIGFLASFTILVALLMSSVKKLRIINLAGAILMIFYGILIQKYPVIIMNIGTSMINLYYLRQMVLKKDYFSVTAVDKNSEYLEQFMSYFSIWIPDKMKDRTIVERSTYRYFILRNMVPAGLFIVTGLQNHDMQIELDFVTPAFRDFKVAKYVYENIESFLYDEGYRRFITYTKNEKHIKYLTRMGFSQIDTSNGIAYVRLMNPTRSE
mgnify:CR=1 FL=1